MEEAMAVKLDRIVIALHVLKVYTNDRNSPVFKKLMETLLSIEKRCENVTKMLHQQKEYNEKYKKLITDITALTCKIDEVQPCAVASGSTNDTPAVEIMSKCHETESQPSSGSSAYEMTPKIDLEISSKTVKKIDFLLLDIDHLTEEDFKSIPKYMVGRITLEIINQFIDVINKALVKKYTILKKQRSTLKSSEMKLYMEYGKEDIPSLKGKAYVSGNNIADSMGHSELDKRGFNIISILRHVQRIYDYRSGNIKVFVVK